MILDHLDNALMYGGLGRRIMVGLSLLNEDHVREAAPGKYEVDGENGTAIAPVEPKFCETCNTPLLAGENCPICARGEDAKIAYYAIQVAKRFYEKEHRAMFKKLQQLSGRKGEYKPPDFEAYLKSIMAAAEHGDD